MFSRNFEMPTSTSHRTCCFFASYHFISRFFCFPFPTHSSQPEGPVAVDRYLSVLQLTPSKAYTHCTLPRPFTMVFWWSSLTSTMEHDWWKNSGHFFEVIICLFLILSVLHQVAVEFLRFKGGFKRYQHLGPPAMASQSKLWISMNQILRSRFNLKCIQKKRKHDM